MYQQNYHEQSHAGNGDSETGKKEMCVLSVGEQAKLLSVIHTHRLGFAIIFDLATDLHIGELCTLRWTDVNFNRQTIKVNHTLQHIKKNMGGA